MKSSCVKYVELLYFNSYLLMYLAAYGNYSYNINSQALQEYYKCSESH